MSKLHILVVVVALVAIVGAWVVYRVLTGSAEPPSEPVTPHGKQIAAVGGHLSGSLGELSRASEESGEHDIRRLVKLVREPWLLRCPITGDPLRFNPDSSAFTEDFRHEHPDTVLAVCPTPIGTNGSQVYFGVTTTASMISLTRDQLPDWYESAVTVDD